MMYFLAVLGGIFLFILAIRFLPIILGVSIAGFVGIGVVIVLIIVFIVLIPFILPLLALLLMLVLVKKLVAR